MKRLITAIGNEKLNNILKGIGGITVEGQDIQYQDGIIEAIEKYQGIDILILNEDIIGNLEVEDLIREIIMIKENIEIILITQANFEISRIKQIIKFISKTEDYENEVLKYLKDKNYIMQEKVTKEEVIEVRKEEEISKNKLKKVTNRKRYVIRDKRKKKDKKIITVIGTSGVRKDNIYILTCDINKSKESISH